MFHDAGRGEIQMSDDLGDLDLCGPMTKVEGDMNERHDEACDFELRLLEHHGVCQKCGWEAGSHPRYPHAAPEPTETPPPTAPTNEHQRLVDAAELLVEAIYPDFCGDLPAALEALAAAAVPGYIKEEKLFEALKKVSRG